MTKMRLNVKTPLFLGVATLALGPGMAFAQGLPPPPASGQAEIVVVEEPVGTAPARVVDTTTDTVVVAQPLTVSGPTENDLAALRYFLDQNDEPAIIAEQERLARQFPDADIDAITARIRAGNVIDTTYAWELVNEDRYDEWRVEVARLQSIDPSWEPPAEMIAVLRQREGQSRFEADFLRRDLNAAVQTAYDYPELVTCERVNNPWRLGELMTDYDQIQPALDTYLNTALTCKDIDIIVASLQKGHAAADSTSWTRGAFEAAQDRHPEHYDRLQLELEELLGRPEDTTPAPVVVTRLDRARTATNNRNYNECLRILQGLTRPTEELARGWCLHNLGQHAQAQAAFNDAAANGSGSVRREARYGLTLSYFAAGSFAQGKALRDTTRFTSSEQSVVERVYLGAAAQNAFGRGRYRDALAFLDNLTLRNVPLTRGQLMVQGWSLARTGRSNEARQVFRTVQATAPGSDVDSALRALDRANED